GQDRPSIRFAIRRSHRHRVLRISIGPAADDLSDPPGWQTAHLNRPSASNSARKGPRDSGSRISDSLRGVALFEVPSWFGRSWIDVSPAPGGGEWSWQG